MSLMAITVSSAVTIVVTGNASVFIAIATVKLLKLQLSLSVSQYCSPTT